MQSFYYLCYTIFSKDRKQRLDRHDKFIYAHPHIENHIKKEDYFSISVRKKIGVNIGNNCFVPDKNCWSSEPYLISVGDHCQITSGVRIFTHGGGNTVRCQIPDFDVFGKVKIGNWCYIGNNSLIMPGVTIGDHVLVASGSVVTKSVPSGVVVAGNPARIICTIEEYLSRNKGYNVGSYGLSHEEKKTFLQSLDESRFITKAYLK